MLYLVTLGASQLDEQVQAGSGARLCALLVRAALAASSAGCAAVAREGCVCLQVRSNRNEQNLSLNFGGLFFGCVEEDFCRHMINNSFIPILQDFSRSTRKITLYNVLT